MEKFLSFKPHMEISQVLEDGDLVCVFFKCTMQANGMENKVFDLYRVKDGKLVEHWDCVQHDTGKVESVKWKFTVLSKTIKLFNQPQKGF